MSKLMSGTVVIYTDGKGVERDATVVVADPHTDWVELEDHDEGYLFWAKAGDLEIRSWQ